MTNPTKLVFTIDLDGKSLPLRFEHRDFAEAEHRLKQPLLGPASLEFWAGGLTGHVLGVLLFVGLHHAIAGLTLDQARAMITFENAAYVEKVIGEAVEASMPKPAPPAGQEPEVPFEATTATGG